MRFALMFLLAAVHPMLLLHDYVHGSEPDNQAGFEFVSLNCGLRDPPYRDEVTNISYVSDDAYITTGEKHDVSSGYSSLYKSDLTLRSFPSGDWNCYTIPSPARGRKYLVRARFLHGNYDGRGNTRVMFDLYIGLDYWFTVYITNAAEKYTAEAITVTVASSLSVCLRNTGHGTPFISSLELRPMHSEMYPVVKVNRSLGVATRINMGASNLLRYPNDTFDRMWWTQNYIGITQSLNITSNDTGMTYYPDDYIRVPKDVLRTAVTTSDTSVPLNITLLNLRTDREYYYYLHFANFEQHARQLDVYYGKNKWEYSPMQLNYMQPTYSTFGASSLYNISLVASNASVLPPMLNAIEVYYMIPHNESTTSPGDVDAVMAIKSQYHVSKNWMGDPCLPKEYMWNGLQCRPDGVESKIISLDLSNSNLHGAIAIEFSFLQSLQYLNLSHNNLNGSVPDSLAILSSLVLLDLSGNHLDGTIPEALCTKGSLNLRYDTNNGDPCNGKSPKKNISVLTVAIVTPVAAVLLVSAMLICCFCTKKRKQQITLGLVHQYIPHSVQPTEIPNSGTHVDIKGHILMSKDHEFTYEDLVKITRKFSECIGEGGFGPVYHGQLQSTEGSIHVAVKMCSRKSVHGQGIREFLAEVDSLKTVHHKHLVMLIGYCTNKNHLALIYEYMPNGSLFDHIRGKKANVQTMSWLQRTRIAHEAAQGLGYLHTGCVLPIIHRDVKSHNILLGKDMHAKISDFGLSKSYNNEAQTHISVTAAGTTGYIDPEYYFSSRLTVKSDVFSFGVVLLEILTGEPPILPGVGHVVKHVEQKVSNGDISEVVDPRLKDAYDIGSVWKVVDIALLCTKDVSDERPTMIEVVDQLKDALTLEEVRHTNTSQGIRPDLSANWGPSAR